MDFTMLVNKINFLFKVLVIKNIKEETNHCPLRHAMRGGRVKSNAVRYKFLTINLIEVIMKTVIHFLFICILFIVSENTFAQTASDYYQPLVKGSQLNFHGAPTQNNNWWSSRTSNYSIVDTDLIAGKEYFIEKAIETEDGTVDTSVFHVFWLRKDSVGNVFMYAFSDSLENIDSAIVVNSNYFPNEFLTKGYSRSFEAGGYTQTDSVISVTASATEPSGNFTNCLEISESHIDSAGNTIFLEYHYYAKGIGMVKNVRTKPDSEAHTDDLTAYGITEVENKNNSIPLGFSLSQNYPNPFNPSTIIRYSIPKSGFVSIKVYNVLGKVVSTLVNEEKNSGNYKVEFSANGGNASKLASGIYFYRMSVSALPSQDGQTGSFVDTKKLILLK